MAECSDSTAVHIARTASTCTGLETTKVTTAGSGMERTLSTTARRRGHQHHPRHTTRRRLDASSRGPAQCGPAGTEDTTIAGDETSSCARITAEVNDNRPHTSHRHPPLRRPALGARLAPESTKINDTTDDTIVVVVVVENERRENDVRERLAQCSPDDPSSSSENKNTERGETTTDLSKVTPRSSSRERNVPGCPPNKDTSPEPEHAVARARGDGNSDDESANVEEDPELEELAKLRCPSERAEVQAEREARRRKRCADYPGLAFGCSIFSSDTMMKFSLIKNELQNIMGNQLKRVSIVRAV